MSSVPAARWPRGHGAAQGDDVSDPERPDATGSGLQTELHAVVRAERFQSLGLGRDPGLGLIDHHASGHARPQVQDNLVTDGQLGAGPVALQPYGTGCRYETASGLPGPRASHRARHGRVPVDPPAVPSSGPR